jgi:hypothetical protein
MLLLTVLVVVDVNGTESVLAMNHEKEKEKSPDRWSQTCVCRWSNDSVTDGE